MLMLTCATGFRDSLPSLVQAKVSLACFPYRSKWVPDIVRPVGICRIVSA